MFQNISGKSETVLNNHSHDRLTEENGSGCVHGHLITERSVLINEVRILISPWIPCVGTSS